LPVALVALPCVAALPATVLAATAADTSALGRTFGAPQLREDLRVLRTTFEGAHAGLYRYSTKATMDSAFDATAARLTHPMTELAFFRELAPLIDLVHDSHTPLATSAGVRRAFRL